MLAAMVGFASPAGAVPQTDACKNGGYARYADPASGDSFKNQGQCVSFVNAGGVLAPVTEEPPAQTVTIAIVDINVDWINEEAFVFRLSSSGLTPQGPVAVQLALKDGQQLSQLGVADASGNWTSGTIGLFCTNPGGLVIRDATTGVLSESIEWPFDGLCEMATEPMITTSQFQNVDDVPLVRVGVEGFDPYTDVRVTLTTSTGEPVASTVVRTSSYGNEYAAFSPSVCDYPDDFLTATASQGDITLTRDIRTSDPNCAFH
jgi:hypothetical protein